MKLTLAVIGAVFFGAAAFLFGRSTMPKPIITNSIIIPMSGATISNVAFIYSCLYLPTGVYNVHVSDSSIDEGSCDWWRAKQLTQSIK